MAAWRLADDRAHACKRGGDGHARSALIASLLAPCRRLAAVVAQGQAADGCCRGGRRLVQGLSLLLCIRLPGDGRLPAAAVRQLRRRLGRRRHQRHAARQRVVGLPAGVWDRQEGQREPADQHHGAACAAGHACMLPCSNMRALALQDSSSRCCHRCRACCCCARRTLTSAARHAAS